MSVFYDNFLRLCRENKTSPSATAQAIGLSKTAAHGWKYGSVPTDITLTKLAEHFGVTVDELTKEEKPAPTNGDELSQDLLIKRALLIDKLQHLELEELAAIDIIVDTIRSKHK